MKLSHELIVPLFAMGLFEFYAGIFTRAVMSNTVESKAEAWFLEGFSWGIIATRIPEISILVWVFMTHGWLMCGAFVLAILLLSFMCDTTILLGFIPAPIPLLLLIPAIFFFSVRLWFFGINPHA